MEQIPVDYFLSADDELVEYLEKQGEETIRDVHLSNTTNVENGYKLLSIQIVGIGSSFLLITQKTNLDYLAVGLAVFTFLWTWCAIYLVCKGLSVKVRPLASAPPDFLYTNNYKTMGSSEYQMMRDAGYCSSEYPLPLIRRFRLVDLCDTSKDLIKLNVKLRGVLDRARLLTILAPMVAMLFSAIFYMFNN